MAKTFEWNQLILPSICFLIVYEIAECAVVKRTTPKSNTIVACKEKPDLEFQSTCVPKRKCWYYSKNKKAVELKEYNSIEYCNLIDLSVCCPAQEYKNMFSSSIKIVEEKCEEYSKYGFHITTAGGTNFPSLTCPTYEPAIARGSIADPLEFPHMLRVGVMQGSDLRWICGATLISEKFALGAAHCATHKNYQKSELVIRLGAKDVPQMKNRQTLFKVIKQHFPPNKNQIEGDPQNYANDIMLFELNDTITFDQYVRPICLYTSPSLPPEGTNATIAGWGDIDTGHPDDIPILLARITTQPSAGHFMEGTVRLDSNRRCSEVFRYDSKLYNSSSMLCSKVDQARIRNESVPCEGDSGGPIQIPWKNHQCIFQQLGIISHGDVACGKFTYSPVYTKISFYIAWIQSIVWPENKIKGNGSDDERLISNSRNFTKKLTAAKIPTEK